MEEGDNIHDACNSRDFELVKIIIEHCGTVQINEKDKHGDTPLHISCSSDDIETVKYLIKHGSATHINEKNNNGSTPLHLSCYHGNLEIVKFLVGNGALINEKDNHGNTLLHDACYKDDNLEIVKLLVGKGLSISQKNNRGNTPLHISCKFLNSSLQETIKYFISLDESGEIIYIKNDENKTALDSLSKEKRSIIEKFIEDNEYLNVKCPEE